MCNLFRLVKERGIEDALIDVEVESYESIHPHNVYASRIAHVSEIEREALNCRR
jgi:GTP cyclohydrolase FolE2